MSRPQPQTVIWITSDHMRYDAIAANGSPWMRTPALDALVAGGVNFHACYAQNPLCMPSRASFMTGLYPQQVGVTHNGHRVPADFTPTVATAFGAGGYQTVQIGKLHFQPHEEMDFDPRPHHAYGFDLFWLSEERGNYVDAYANWLSGKYPELAARFRCPRSNDPARACSERQPAPIDAPWQASHAGWILDTALRYLDSRRQGRHFLHLGFYNPHPPLTPVREAWDAYANVAIPPPRDAGEEWRDKPEPLARMLRARRTWSGEDFAAYRRGYAALVTEMDYAIGALIEALRARGRLDNTLLVFSSDHGDHCGDHGITHKGPEFYDAVMRVPLVLHWPEGLGTARRDVPGLAEMVDLLPTLLGLCDAPVPPVMVGRDLAPDLLAGAVPAGRSDVFAYHGGGQAMLRTAAHKYLRYEPAGTEVLYDYRDAQAEVVNHATDPACAAVLAEMRTRMLTRALQSSCSPQPQRNLY